MVYAWAVNPYQLVHLQQVFSTITVQVLTLVAAPTVETIILWVIIPQKESDSSILPIRQDLATFLDDRFFLR
jgi:hypothetical protein